MQSHDSQVPGTGSVLHTDYEDAVTQDTHQAESHTVATGFAPGTDRKLKRGALTVAAVLAAGFVVVETISFLHNRSLARDVVASDAAARPVDVVRAAATGAVRHFSLPGETAAWYTSTLYARVNGYVAHWYVDIGDVVKKGQVLALIDTPELDAQLTAARAQLEASQAQVLVRRAEADVGKSTWERWRDSPPGVVSEQEREEKRAIYSSSDAQLKASIAQQALDQARVDQYAVLAQFKQVRAPYDGRITQRYIDIGNLVTAGSTSATTPLYVMTQNNPLRVMVDVPQSVAGELVQDSLPVTISGTGGSQALTATGKVTRTAGALNTQSRTMKVEVDIPNGDDHWLPGMYISAAFDLPPKGTVEVPAAALLFHAGSIQVATVDAHGKVALRNVTIARDDGSVVELGSGVEPGERLILNLSSQIEGGDTVQVNPERQQP